jgi:hypothetical protein
MNAVQSRLSRRDQIIVLLAIAVAATFIFPPVGAVAWIVLTMRLWRENRGFAVLTGILAVVLILFFLVFLGGFLATGHGGSSGPIPIPSPPHS